VKRWHVLVVVVLVAAAVGILARPRHPVWTTSSAQARVAFEAGLEADRKFYFDEAVDHFKQALELDPGFVVADLFLAQSLDGKGNEARRKELFERVRKADLGELSARERFLVSLALAQRDHEEAKASAILDAYVATHPDDPYALSEHAGRAFAAGDWDTASRDYRHLAEVAPNFVVAYNQLGYIAMAQGRFAEAEALLKKYRYVAPEQANPHDSLGELYAITGRYAEAESEFEEALRVKPGFCPSFGHLVQLDLLSGDFDRAAAVVARAATKPACPSATVSTLRRSVTMWRAAAKKDWKTLIAEGESTPNDESGDRSILLALGYCQTGRIGEAKAIEARVRGELDKVTAEDAKAGSRFTAPLLYLEGQRLLFTGDAEGATQRFAKVDSLLTWRGLDDGLFKLFNLTMLMRASRRAGHLDAAARVEDTLRTVNPVFAAALDSGRGILAGTSPQ
jgi:Flp pilus assembly protein TadD